MEGSGRGLMLRYYSGIRLEELRKYHKKPAVWIAGLRAEK
jgi:hypothetical protein